jgi:ABC-type glycerol-3-phosphate transport system substrate-binding protein
MMEREDISPTTPPSLAAEESQGGNMVDTPVSSSKKAVKPKKMVLIAGLAFAVLVLVLIIINFVGRSVGSLQKGGEIVWWGIKEEDDAVNSLIADFEAKNPGVKVKYQRQSEKDYAERLFNSLKKGAGPDIFEIHTSWIPDFNPFISTLPKSIMSEEEYRSTFLPAVYRSLRTEKGIVGIPLYYDAITLFVNIDIFNNAQKSFPKTWNDIIFLSDPQKGGLTLRDNDELIQSAIALGTTSNVDHWQEILALVMIQNGINPASPNIESTNDTFLYLKNFVKSGVWNDRMPPSTIAFARGNLAMYFGTISRAPEILVTNPSIRFRTVPFPQVPNNAPTDPQYSYSSYYFQTVNKKSLNEDTAWKFLKFLSEKESIKKLNSFRKISKAFEFPSPRIDMIADLEKDIVMGSVLTQATEGWSWYLADQAHDGAGGINTNIASLYKEAFDKGEIDEIFVTNLKATLSKYGIR